MECHDSDSLTVPVCQTTIIRWFVASTIIGATSMAQLKENVNAWEKTLSEECIADIGTLHLVELQQSFWKTGR